MKRVVKNHALPTKFISPPNQHPAGEMSDEAVQSSAVFVTVWRHYAESFQHSEILERNGLAISWSDVPWGMFNNIFVTGPVDDPSVLASRVHDAVSFAATKRFSGQITLCHELFSCRARCEVEKVLSREQYAPAVPLIGMVGDFLPIAKPAPPDLHIERQADGSIVHDLNCLAYGLPPELGQRSLLPPAFWHLAFAYVAFEGDRPVATATTIVQPECLYLALVATVPDAQGKGYGQMVLAHSLRKAHQANGLTRTMLHSTEAGWPLYNRLGYRSVARFTCYAPASTLSVNGEVGLPHEEAARGHSAGLNFTQSAA